MPPCSTLCFVKIHPNPFLSPTPFGRSRPQGSQGASFVSGLILREVNKIRPWNCHELSSLIIYGKNNIKNSVFPVNSARDKFVLFSFFMQMLTIFNALKIYNIFLFTVHDLTLNGGLSWEYEKYEGERIKINFPAVLPVCGFRLYFHYQFGIEGICEVNSN